MELRGAVALVTGASRGVGAAVAVALAEAGADVALAARSTAAAPQRTPGTLEETAARVEAAGGRALILPTDLADPAAPQAMVDAAVAHFGRLDVLVNNAAVTFVGDLDIPLRRHELIMAVDLHAPFLAIRAARPYLARHRGAIVNVSSVAALEPYPGLMSYGMAKAALERLTVDAARQLAVDGIAVNCFRIDVPVASEGFVANAPDLDHGDWEPCEVAAEGIVWLLQQPPSHTGRLESMHALRAREGIMASRATRPYLGTPPTVPVQGA